LTRGALYYQEFIKRRLECKVHFFCAAITSQRSRKERRLGCNAPDGQLVYIYPESSRLCTDFGFFKAKPSNSRGLPLWGSLLLSSKHKGMFMSLQRRKATRGKS